MRRCNLGVPALLPFLLATLVAACARPSPSAAPAPRSTEATVRAIADGVVRDATFRFVDSAGRRYASPGEAAAGVPLRLESGYNDWRYWNGVLNLAMLRLSAAAGKPAYAAFARRNVAFAFDSYGWFERGYDGRKWEYPFAQRFVMEELDDYGAMGASVVEVYRQDPQPRYRDYALRAGAYALTRQGRLPDGTLVRASPRKWTLWADDLYMSVSLLARLGELTGEARWFDDAALQVVRFHQHLFDDSVGLMRHDWYSNTGRPGVAFWGRANGWALVAQVDLLDRLPRHHPARDTLLALLRRHIDGVARWQSPSGLWHQLLDRDDSYLETSASAMFTYAIAHSVERGWIPRRYLEVARRGWAGVRTRVRADGRIEGVCTGTVVSADLRDYYARPTPLNDVHGIGTVLLAGAEMLALERGGRSSGR